METVWRVGLSCVGMATMTNSSDRPILIRRVAASDTSLLSGWENTEPVAWVDDVRLRQEMNTRNYRPEWSWIAEREGAFVGRALWWGSDNAERAATLDCLLVSDETNEPEEVGAALIAAGLKAFAFGSSLEFNIDVASGWADDPAAVQAVRWREMAARAGSFSRTTERVSFARVATAPRPGRSSRLQFKPASNEAFRALFAGVAEGSLDAHSLDMVAREGVDALADDDLEFYLSLPGERDSWRVAVLDTGETVGFIIPTRTAHDASISYLGVLPGHRGNGYVHDLLAEMVHVHHDDGQARIVGTTDAANTPMRSAFDRAGFRITRKRIEHEQ